MNHMGVGIVCVVCHIAKSVGLSLCINALLLSFYPFRTYMDANLQNTVGGGHS